MNTNDIPRYTLKQYTRLILAFFAALVLLIIYQYTVLFVKGVVDTILSTSFLLSIVHHMGFASLAGLICVPFFNFFENWRSKVGFKIVVAILLTLLIIETLLVGYYCMILAPLGQDMAGFNFEDFKATLSISWGTMISMLMAMVLISWLFRIIYKVTKRYYHHIAKMYPFTIILFSLFVATLFLDGKPINQNKTQYLAMNMFKKSKSDLQIAKTQEFNNSETVWISSVFSGKNFDKAYLTAKELAYEKEYDKSLLLSRYILSQVPDHIDAKILMGRINAWSGNYEKSIEILKGCEKTNPDYVDAYAALLDVCFWSGNVDYSREALKIINRNNINTKEIESKIIRAQNALDSQIKKKIVKSNIASYSLDEE